MKTNWKNIYNYEDIAQISDSGLVKRFARTWTFKNGRTRYDKEDIRKGYINVQGYYATSFNKNNKTKGFKVHRLVATAFVPNPLNLPEVNHKNGNKLDNRAKNLEWVTSSDNKKHAFANGLMNQKGEKNNSGWLKEKQVLYIRENPKKLSRKELAKKFNTSVQNIYSIIKRKSWKHI